MMRYVWQTPEEQIWQVARVPPVARAPAPGHVQHVWESAALAWQVARVPAVARAPPVARVPAVECVPAAAPVAPVPPEEEIFPPVTEAPTRPRPARGKRFVRYERIQRADQVVENRWYHADGTFASKIQYPVGYPTGPNCEQRLRELKMHAMREADNRQTVNRTRTIRPYSGYRVPPSGSRPQEQRRIRDQDESLNRFASTRAGAIEVEVEATRTTPNESDARRSAANDRFERDVMQGSWNWLNVDDQCGSLTNRQMTGDEEDFE